LQQVGRPTDTPAHGDPAFQHEGANLVDDAGAEWE
jgi:hypothetical protein